MKASVEVKVSVKMLENVGGCVRESRGWWYITRIAAASSTLQASQQERDANSDQRSDAWHAHLVIQRPPHRPSASFPNSSFTSAKGGSERGVSDHPKRTRARTRVKRGSEGKGRGKRSVLVLR